ncbi:MAG: lysozyme [Alphaproteobacteria bacterium]|nr:lysozyme [Alphaproteobacteria bacterium]
MYEDLETCGGFAPHPAWMTRRVSEEGIALIKEYEGLRLRAYRCPGQVWTIGYGHTRSVHQGMEISAVEAEQLLKDDLFIVEQALSRLVKVPLNDSQFAALACFIFNVGIANFERSTLLKLLNRGWYEQVPAQFTRWNKVAGQEMGGLSRRRAAEGRLWNSCEDIIY